MVTSAILLPYERQARRLFSTAPDRFDTIRTNPVTGSCWLNRVDPIGEQIRNAARALMAQDYFATTVPPDVPPLPLSYGSREDYKVGGLSHIVAWFARSLEACKYDCALHPLFEPYARGVLASPYTYDQVAKNTVLQARFPARQLKGLGPGLYWDPSLAPIRSAPRWQQKQFLGAPPPPQATGSHASVNRQDANAPPDYAPNAPAFLQLDDEFVAHATNLAPYKRLPSGWKVYKPADVFAARLGAYQFWLVKSAYGWLIEREQWGGAEEVLANILSDSPVLCDTYVTAARLAEAVQWGLRPEYLLTWINVK